MFQFPGFALLTLCIQVKSTWLCRLMILPVPNPRTSPKIETDKTTGNIQVGCPIRKFMDQSLFPAPHDLSQGITSFIASCCQGIHQTPLSRLI